MIYEYCKYNSIEDFIKNNKKNDVEEEFTIVDKCEGIDFLKKEFNSNCFACLFCILDSDNEFINKFKLYWGENLIREYANLGFNSNYFELPTSKNIINPIFKNLEDFTSINETKNIQPWAAGILKNTSSNECRIGMEIPAFNNDYDRNGRIDICAINQNNRLLIMESKVSLDDALKDERFVEQEKKYTNEIRKYSSNFLYLTIFGGMETDFYPTTSEYCSGIIGNKTNRLYKLITDNNMKFISANALFIMCCKYLIDQKYSWDNFLYKVFSNNDVIGLLSSGVLVKESDEIILKKIEDLF